MTHRNTFHHAKVRVPADLRRRVVAFVQRNTAHRARQMLHIGPVTLEELLSEEGQLCEATLHKVSRDLVLAIGKEVES